MRTKQPAAGLAPVLILIVPVVSDPLIDVVPPLPRTALLILARLGAGPVKAMWLGICSLALPLRIRLVTVICDAVTAPLNEEVPATFRSRNVVLP